MLTWSSLKAYFRNRGAIFFSLLVPLMIMGIFGLINFGNSTPTVNIGIVDQANNQVSQRMVSSLQGIKAVKLHRGRLDSEKHELQQGNRDLFFSQLVTRLTTVALQIAVLLAVGLFLFHFHFAGNLLYLLIVGIIGGGIFLAMGLAISGASKSEETAAPIANLVSLPLMFLSGIFFSRSNMPEWLQTITQYSPLTYVSDALL